MKPANRSVRHALYTEIHIHPLQQFVRIEIGGIVVPMKYLVTYPNLRTQGKAEMRQQGNEFAISYPTAMNEEVTYLSQFNEGAQHALGHAGRETEQSEQHFK